MRLMELCLSGSFGGLEILVRDFAEWIVSNHGGIEVHMVGRDYEDVVEPLPHRLRLLILDHLVVALVPLDRVRPVRGLVHRDLRVGMEGSRHDPSRPIKKDGLLMGVDDERAPASTHESYVQGSLRHGIVSFRCWNTTDLDGHPPPAGERQSRKLPREEALILFNQRRSVKG